VHSYVQILAAADSGGRSTSQHSQLGRSSSTSQDVPHRGRADTEIAAIRLTKARHVVAKGQFWVFFAFITMGAKMADLKVDYDELEASRSTVEQLKSEFDGLPHRVSGYEDAWGDGRIKGAMHKFASNWDYRRGLISEDMKEFTEKVTSCLDTFTQADKALAEKMTKPADK
jgi:hypothetical protein